MSFLLKLKEYSKRFSGVEQKLLLVFISLIVVSSFVLATNAQNGENRVAAHGGEYTEGLVGQPLHINPLLSPANDVDSDLVSIIYASLYEFDQDLNLTADLAEALPEISTDGKTYTITLREGVVWHDGAPLTADDVIFTFQSIQNPEYQSPLRFSWNKVEIIKENARTIKLTLKDPSAPFIANLNVGILPKHIWESVPANSFALSQFNLRPIGSGPYHLSEIERARSGAVQTITLESFDKYHKGRPYIDQIRFRFFETTDQLINAYQGKKIQGLGYWPFDRNLFIKPRENLNQHSLTLPHYQAVFINRLKNPAALNDLNIRLAIAKSVDKQKIIDEVYGGQATEAYGPILPGHLGYHEQIPGAGMNIYNIEEAIALLEKSGWKTDPETGFRKDDQGRIITLALATNNNFPPNVRVAELLKEMWQSIGIQIILNIESLTDLEENYIRPRNYELLLFSENVGADPDPYPFWHSTQLRDPGLNLTNFNNSTADKLLVDARGHISPVDRAAKYRQFQEIFVGDVPAVFLTRSVYTYNISDEIKGLELNALITPSSRFTNIANWYIKTKRK